MLFRSTVIVCKTCPQFSFVDNDYCPEGAFVQESLKNPMCVCPFVRRPRPRRSIQFGHFLDTKKCKTARKEAKVDKTVGQKAMSPQMQRRKSFLGDPKMNILGKSIILDTKNTKLLGRKQNCPKMWLKRKWCWRDQDLEDLS